MGSAEVASLGGDPVSALMRQIGNTVTEKRPLGKSPYEQDLEECGFSPCARTPDMGISSIQTDPETDPTLSGPDHPAGPYLTSRTQERIIL